MSKARDLADIISGNFDIPSDSLDNANISAISGQTNSDTSFLDIPAGTTAERPASPTTGNLRFNTTLDQLEQYTADSGWQGISAPPTISSVDVSSFDYNQSTQTVVITGQNFDATATGALVNANGATLTPTTSTRNSSSQITITFTGSDRADADTPEPLDVKVANGSGLTAILEDAISINDAPAWTTSAGSLGTVYEDVAASNIQLAASDIETGGSIVYSITSGSLPSGMSMSSSGLITGTPNVNDSYNASGVTHNFTVTATGSDGDTTPRAFNILRKWYDGSSSTQAANSALEIKNLTGTTTSGLYYINVSGQGAVQTWCDMTTDGGGWTLVFKYHNYNANNFVWPTSNTYYAMPAGDPRNSTYGQTNGNLPYKYSGYGATSSSNATVCLFEQYDYSDGNASYIYRGTFTSAIGSVWDSNSWNNYNNNFMPASMSQTQIVDRCSDNNGTRPTTDSLDGYHFNDKASPGSTGNWDIGGFVSGSSNVGKQGANCGRHGEAGPGSHRNASVLIWVK